jgi:hypothetical protein
MELIEELHLQKLYKEYVKVFIQNHTNKQFKTDIVDQLEDSLIIHFGNENIILPVIENIGMDLDNVIISLNQYEIKEKPKYDFCIFQVPIAVCDLNYYPVFMSKEDITQTLELYNKFKSINNSREDLKINIEITKAIYEFLKQNKKGKKIKNEFYDILSIKNNNISDDNLFTAISVVACSLVRNMQSKGVVNISLLYKFICSFLESKTEVNLI